MIKIPIRKFRLRKTRILINLIFELIILSISFGHVTLGEIPIAHLHFPKMGQDQTNAPHMFAIRLVRWYSVTSENIVSH